MKKACLLIIILLLSGCSHQAEEGKEVTAPMEKTNQVLLNVSAEESMDQAVLKLSIQNDTDMKKTFTFPSGQTYELSVTDQEGNEVYRYSKGKMFTQTIRELTLEPGEKKEYQEVWGYRSNGNKAASGEYKVEALFLGKEKAEKPLKAQTKLTIPEK